MSNDTSVVRVAINENDLITPTATQQYPLGYIHTIENPAATAAAVRKFMYVKSGGALTAYNVYLIDFSSTAATELVTGTPATSAVYRRYGVPQVAFTSGYYGFVAIEGDVTIASTGNTTLGHTGKAANGVTTCTDESAATVSASTICLFKATQTVGASNVKAYLVGTLATVA